MLPSVLSSTLFKLTEASRVSAFLLIPMLGHSNHLQLVALLRPLESNPFCSDVVSPFLYGCSFMPVPGSYAMILGYDAISALCSRLQS